MQKLWECMKGPCHCDRPATPSKDRHAARHRKRQEGSQPQHTLTQTAGVSSNPQLGDRFLMQKLLWCLTKAFHFIYIWNIVFLLHIETVCTGIPLKCFIYITKYVISHKNTVVNNSFVFENPKPFFYWLSLIKKTMHIHGLQWSCHFTLHLRIWCNVLWFLYNIFFKKILLYPIMYGLTI